MDELHLIAPEKLNRIVVRRHETYKESDDLKLVLQALKQEQLPWGYLSRIAGQTQIPKQTLSRWRGQLQQNPDWVPWQPDWAAGTCIDISA